MTRANSYPVSIIMPTYNAEAYLKRSLDSLFRQTCTSFEVLVIDGGSQDRTLEIASQYAFVRVLNNPKRIAEFGKYIGFLEAKYSIIVLLDSDNVVVNDDWIERMLKPLIDDPSIAGVESNYLIADDFTPVNKYATLLVIADPLARMLATRPIITRRDGYSVKYYAPHSSIASGANGFFWRREVIQKNMNNRGTIDESNLISRASEQNGILIANIPGVGIYHYYCSSFRDFLGKRNKIGKKFLERERITGASWVGNRKITLPLASLYLVLVIPALIESIVNIVRQRRLSWLWHAPASFCTIIIYAKWKVRQRIGK